MEEREIKSFTEEELFNKVKEASFDFLYKTRNITSKSVPYELWLCFLEEFVRNNMNVVATGFIENLPAEKHFRYQHSYWLQYGDVLLEIDGVRKLNLSNHERENLSVKIKQISWDIDKFPSHGVMLKIYIVFKEK